MKVSQLAKCKINRLAPKLNEMFGLGAGFQLGSINLDSQQEQEIGKMCSGSHVYIHWFKHGDLIHVFLKVGFCLHVKLGFGQIPICLQLKKGVVCIKRG